MEPSVPARKPRASFLRRHSATLLTAGLVVYTVALGVAITDDAFHLGIFPTQLELEARGHIARFDSADEAERRQAADQLIREIDAFVAVPELIRVLDSRTMQVRTLAAECLGRITKANLDYDPAASPAGRRAAIARWRQWFQEHRERL